MTDTAAAAETLKGRMTLERMAGTMPVHSPIYPEPPYYYRNLELLSWTYETDEDAAADVLPDCLELRLPAVATVAVLDAPICTLGTYQEAFLSVAATFRDEPVQYVVNNLLTSDAAIAVGREIWGVPKKLGHVELQKFDQGMVGVIERPRGVRLATGTFRPERLVPREEARPFAEPLLTLRVVPHPEGLPPKVELIEHFSPQTNNARLTEDFFENQFTGAGHVDFEVESGLDPWFRFPVRKMLRAAYLGGNWSFELPWGRILHTY